MKSLYAAVISGFLACGGAAMAQDSMHPATGSPTTPPQPSQQAMPTQDDTNHSMQSNGENSSMSDKHAAMKSCIAQQQQNNSGMSKKDARKACKAQMKSQTPG
jgi:hypothetical protein